MSGGELPGLGRKSAAFALAALFAIGLNTILACVKDANLPFKKFLASFTGHDWTTQGILVVQTFAVLGFIFLALGLPGGGRLAERSGRFISLFVLVVAASGLGLAAWYLLY